MKMIPKLAHWLLIGVAIFAVAPAHANDPINGERLAQRWCVACHIISGDQKQASDAPPSFATIARKPNFNASQLAFFLLNPHPVMPNMGLSRLEASDLAAFIARQAK
jgi:mono/diheme cytochrome c family protein